MTNKDSLNTQSELTVNGQTYQYHSLKKAEQNGLEGISRLPKTLKILLENLLRYEDGDKVTKEDLHAMADWLTNCTSKHQIAYHPGRVLMQDFTGVPAVVDLAAMRDAYSKLGFDADGINPLAPVDLIIDHSVQVDKFGNPEAFENNVNIEMLRNRERYQFLCWGQKAFKNFRVVPPGTGICHQVNLEYLGKGVWDQQREDSSHVAYPDTLVGTDSHTTMINGLGVLGWGVGGIEAEAAMLSQPISMLIPEVIGFRLTGQLREGVTATDLVLTVTQMLRRKGVVGKFVEFFGPGLSQLPLADRATIANMSPEYGATCGFFPIDEETIKYMDLTNRDQQTMDLVRAYCQEQGMWRHDDEQEPYFTDTLELNLDEVEASLAGPKRPQDRVSLSEIQSSYERNFQKVLSESDERVPVEGEDYTLGHGDMVIAAITSCTNTSNPSVLLAAGLVAKNALEKGLEVKPWVKTSLAPGSKVVTDYLDKTGLQEYLNDLGFYLVGYGCTTCIGNSGPLPDPIAKAIDDNNLAVSSVLSGNRNFEGRVHPQVKANWLASPPLVVAFALAGTARIDLSCEPIGYDQNNEPVYLNDIWPSKESIREYMQDIDKAMFERRYSNVFEGDASWKSLKVEPSKTYNWQDDSTYIQNPPFFEGLTTEVPEKGAIEGARVLALLGDSITTDHISPAGAIKKDSPAGRYLMEHGVKPADFNSYGSRRGNHEVMMRGTFANIRIRNEMVPHIEGGYTKHIPTGEDMAIYDAAMRYKEEGTPLVVIAGKEYGTGSSRDWAAKGTKLLGVEAVIAESYERIHRSNLIGMGVLPLQFKKGDNRESLSLTGEEKVTIESLDGKLEPRMDVQAEIEYADGTQKPIILTCRIDTGTEAKYYQNDGILQYVLRDMAQAD